jgi:phage-related tail fiber protein
MAITINGSTGLTFPDSTTQATSGVTPSGTIIYVAQNTVPTGYIKANGATLSRTTYAALFAAIGTTFGAGDGSTTFLVPDLRGEFLRGWDDGRGVDSGRAFGSAQLDQMQKLTGFIETDNANAAQRGAFVDSSGVFTLSGTAVTDFGSGASAFCRATAFFDSANSPDARVSSTTSGETRSRNIALLACIKF